MRGMICGIAGLVLALLPSRVWSEDKPVAQPAFSPDTIISYSGGGCYGPCPAYRVDIHGDGSVTFEGQAYTLQKGITHYQIDPADVSKLYAFIAARDFWSLRDKYEVTWTDQIYHEVCVTTAAQKKCVIDYSGENVGMPHAVKEIEAEIDRVGRTAPLIGKP